MAQFYDQDANLRTDLERTFNDAFSNEQISNDVVDGLSPLPLDQRAQEPFAFGEMSRGKPGFITLYSLHATQIPLIVFVLYTLPNTS